MTESPLTDVELADRLKAALARIARRARQQAPQSLTAGQVSTLSALHMLGPVRLVALAAHEGVSAPTQSRLAASLESQGLIGRTPDPADGRASLITLTEEGRAKLFQVRDDRSAFYAARVAALPPEQRAALAAALPALEAISATES